MNTRMILLQGLHLQASIGMLAHERSARQPLTVDAWFEVRADTPVDDRDLATVLDYRLLRSTLIDEITQDHTDLLETLVQRCLQRILAGFPEVLHARIRICKPDAFEDCDAVCIEQMGHQAGTGQRRAPGPAVPDGTGRRPPS
ncbi:dihydroneopterin aldolase [Castellaniella sp.]|uniref:dihydroneopterin aldolase n=1 Tax=Castellaniella sp. TaxID=1955812 RepID=UPI00355F1CCB